MRWKPNHVEVTTQGSRTFRARRLLVTLPLSLLQNSQSAAARVRFSPPLPEVENAARKLKLGPVVKVILRFRTPFWEHLTLPGEDRATEDLKDLTFIHAPAERLPTWWTQFPVKTPIITGWAGGGRAEELARESDDSLLDQSLQTLAHVLQTSRPELEESLADFYTHNWEKDPFSAGAYSYIPVGGTEAQAQLAKPLSGTLFFAGEAINTQGHQGTVHGAIASGLRAARDICQIT